MPISRRAVAVLSALVAGAASLVVGAAPAGAAEHSVFAYGDAPFHGSTGLVPLNHPVVGMARTPSGDGYWLAARDGRVSPFGRAGLHGSLASAPPSPVIGIAATPSGRGYWLATTDGGVYTFGDAAFLGSLGDLRLAKPIVGIAATRSGGGYWLVAEDGGVFTFGDAGFHGSTGALTLNQPITGMAPTASGGGYWLVARDGGIFSFGDAVFHGSTGAMTLARPIVGMAATAKGRGYWLVAGDGGLFTFGDAVFHGSLGGGGLTEPAVGVVGSTSGDGYWIVTTGHLARSSTANVPQRTIVAGAHRVSALGPVVPGTYRAMYATDDCRWERSASSDGDTASALAKVTSDDRQVVTIRSGDGSFRTSGCAPFVNELFPITPSLYAPVGDGTWIVNTDVGPGVWGAPGGPSCRWSRVGDFSGDAAGVIESGSGTDHPVVRIASGDVGFVADGCGTWTRSSAAG